MQSASRGSERRNMKWLVLTSLLGASQEGSSRWAFLIGKEGNERNLIQLPPEVEAVETPGS